jgi:hypothetical protein
MPRLAAALVGGLLMAFGIAACGGGNSDVSDVVPKTIPDLVAPKDTSLPDVTVSTTDTTTTGTTTTPSTSGTGATGAGTGAGTGGTGAATTGGGASSGGGTGTSGNGSVSGGLSPFCQSNPGAC